MPKQIQTGALILGLLAAAGCARYDRLDRPFPKLTATTLEGRELTAESFRGHLWIINLWVPG
ncbi:MAG: hypothetical protein HY901_00080 [Deltaproteobacteria bacterium]|nr:hypothetical protein [Deltaproteobacteria bacterium]